MKYLKKFDTQAAYNAAQSSLILPNVSLVTENNKVEYNPTPSHDYVEIGGIKWATMNVGASSISDAGLYFQWGDTSGYTAAQVGTKKRFNWVNYKYGNGKSSPGATGMTKYNSTDGKTVLDLSDDAVNVAWGGNWKTPTTEQFQALGTATTSAWTADYEGSGVAGLVLTSKADSSKKLFFPIVGCAIDGAVLYVGSRAYYWSSSLVSNSVVDAYNVHFTKNSVTWQNEYGNRYYGFPVRGILDE